PIFGAWYWGRGRGIADGPVTTTGSYITNRVTDKLTPVHDRIFCCCSGSAADTQAVADAVTYQFGFHSIELNEPPLVHTAASLVKEMCYPYREDLMAGIIVDGWDQREGGQLYSVAMAGMMVRQAFAIGGSSSSYVCGYVDATYREGMTKEECLQFTANALALAMEQDGSNGGVIRLAAIAESGVEWQVLLGDQISKVTIATISPPLNPGIVECSKRYPIPTQDLIVCQKENKRGGGFYNTIRETLRDGQRMQKGNKKNSHFSITY
uniref:proteasome endopeptidase complex n=1 Tax=Prolemur simus TaxID=1328070 RepID=A0A8C8Z1I9_PROSS